MTTEDFELEQMDDELKTEQDNYLASSDLRVTGEEIFSPSSTQKGISKRASEHRLVSERYEAGEIINERYKIVKIIGSGGFGVVYEAYDTAANDQRVAIKTLKHNVADYELAAQRFEREIELCGSIQSRHVVKILDSGMADDETLFYVMEFLEGQTLEDLLGKHERLSFYDVKNILLQALDAVAEAHSNNIVHRDLKPSNIWLRNRSAEEHDFEVKILDFGIAKSLDPNQEKAHKLTQTGAWMGSPAYMSPEHLAGSRELTPASDIFSLGLIAIEMLTGYPAIDGDSPMEVALAIASTDEIVIDDWILDSSIGNIIERCVKKNPKDRYQSGDELAAALRAIEDTTLKIEYATAKMHRRIGRRSTTMSTTGSINDRAMNTQRGLSPEIQKANREIKIQIALIAGIVLCLFAVGIFFVVRKYTENNFMKPITDEQRQAFQAERDKSVQELVAAQMKIENSKRFIGLRMGTGMKQGAVWGGFCDDICIQNHSNNGANPIKNAPPSGTIEAPAADSVQAAPQTDEKTIAEPTPDKPSQPVLDTEPVKVTEPTQPSSGRHHRSTSESNTTGTASKSGSGKSGTGSKSGSGKSGTGSKSGKTGSSKNKPSGIDWKLDD